MNTFSESLYNDVCMHCEPTRCIICTHFVRIVCTHCETTRSIVGATLMLSIFLYYLLLSSPPPLKELFTNFEFITFFSCLNIRNILYKRSISIKQLRLEIIEKNGTQSRSVLYLYITELGWVDLVDPFS